MNVRLLIFMGLLACLYEASAATPVSEDRLRAHIEFLASDSLWGRDTGTPGYRISAEYVAAHFRALGLTPAGDNGTFFHSVPLVETRLVTGSAEATIINDDGETALSYPDDFIMGSDASRTETSVTAELVFVGYGIVAPDRHHDDYAGLDVEGKIVVRLPGRPESWPSEEAAHLASGREKARNAVAHGAIGMVTLHTPREEATFPWEANLQYLDIPDMRWQGEDGAIDGHFPQLQGGVYLHPDVAGTLFEGAELSLDEIFSADLAGEAIPGFPLNARMTLARQSTHRTLSSPNVVAVLPGSDPDLRDEYLVYTAHLDHLGVITNDEGVDEIYPGAMDNAAGIATMLETARVLAAEKDGLRRSVMFIALTAEEKGLVGAGYFARYPTVPIESLVANINLDMPYLGFDFADVIAFGAEHSSLQGVVAASARAAGLTLAPDPMPEQVIFVRSDHYRFVQQGVPAVMLATGMTSVDPDEDGRALFDAFIADRYHQPLDNLDQPIDYGAARKFTEVNVNIGRRVAREVQRPGWNPGSFFGELFGR